MKDYKNVGKEEETSTTKYIVGLIGILVVFCVIISVLWLS